MIYLSLLFSSSTFHTSQFFYLFLLLSCFSVLGYPLCGIVVAVLLDKI